MSLSLQYKMTCFAVWCPHPQWQAEECNAWDPLLVEERCKSYFFPSGFVYIVSFLLSPMLYGFAAFCDLGGMFVLLWSENGSYCNGK